VQDERHGSNFLYSSFSCRAGKWVLWAGRSRCFEMCIGRCCWLGWGGDVDVDERDVRWRGNGSESESESESEEGVMGARGRESR